jgi:RimJ/RimL family protein N-acetyltransferase
LLTLPNTKMQAYVPLMTYYMAVDKGQPPGHGVVPDYPVQYTINEPPREPMQGRYCRLEPLDPDRHAGALFEADAADADGRSWTYLAYGPFRMLADYRDWMCATSLGDDTLFFAILDQADGEAAGLASYLRITPAAGSIEVGGIHYAPRLQRSPAATEAMFLLMTLLAAPLNGSARARQRRSRRPT